MQQQRAAQGRAAAAASVLQQVQQRRRRRPAQTAHLFELAVRQVALAQLHPHAVLAVVAQQLHRLLRQPGWAGAAAAAVGGAASRQRCRLATGACTLLAALRGVGHPSALAARVRLGCPSLPQSSTPHHTWNRRSPSLRAAGSTGAWAPPPLAAAPPPPAFFFFCSGGPGRLARGLVALCRCWGWKGGAWQRARALATGNPSCKCAIGRAAGPQSPQRLPSFSSWRQGRQACSCREPPAPPRCWTPPAPPRCPPAAPPPPLAPALQHAAEALRLPYRELARAADLLPFAPQAAAAPIGSGQIDGVEGCPQLRAQRPTHMAL